MDREQIRSHCRWFFLREGVLYVLVLGVALLCIDLPGVVQSIKIRELNDITTGMDSSQLLAFSQGHISAEQVDWDRLITYFNMVLKFFPQQEDVRMFLGYCDFYGLGDERAAFEKFCTSANNVPYYFWNVYDTAILLFKAGDMEHAIFYLKFALLVPGPKMSYAMANSIVYRQFFMEAFNTNLEVRFNKARENAVLLLTAAYFLQKDYEMANLFATKGVSEPGITDREPFYFYAGAIAMAKGNKAAALDFFEKAMKAGSDNPLAYRYAADILKKEGHLAEAARISLQKMQLGKQIPENQFMYPERIRVEIL